MSAKPRKGHRAKPVRRASRPATRRGRKPTAKPAKRAASTQNWQWSKVQPLFPKHGCSVKTCAFHRPPDCSGDTVFCCALNVSDALIRAGYSLPSAADVEYCKSHEKPRVRNANGMARICDKQNGGKPDVQDWKNRPSWKGIVYFEGGTVSWHIDLWNGTSAEHTQYPDANVVWFWKMG
jgi:hypothetical protein